MSHPLHYTAFVGHHRLASGDMHAVTLAVHRALAADPTLSVLVFSDETGKLVDLDLRGTESEVLSRLPEPSAEPSPAVRTETLPRGRGRPRLGVIAREVTLLPEHWDWLASQPGGISVALRKLVHQARRSAAHDLDAGKARERTYAFMAAMAGDLPGFEEASRALFAGDWPKLAAESARWPKDVQEHMAHLAATRPESPGMPPG